MDEAVRVAAATIIASGVVGAVQLGLLVLRRLRSHTDWTDDSRLSL